MLCRLVVMGRYYFAININYPVKAGVRLDLEWSALKVAEAAF